MEMIDNKWATIDICIRQAQKRKYLIEWSARCINEFIPSRKGCAEVDYNIELADAFILIGTQLKLEGKDHGQSDT